MVQSQKTLAVDCRMTNMSGIGVYLRHVLPLCIRALPQTLFRLIGATDLLERLGLTDAGACIRVVPCSAPIYSLREQLELPRLAAGADALWVPHYNIPLFAACPLAVTVHDMAHLALPTLFGPLKRAYARILFGMVRRNARMLFFDSIFTRDEFHRLIGTPHGEGMVAPLGISPTWFETDGSVSPFPGPYLVAVGNLKPHKNIVTLCRAFAGLGDEYSHHLVLVGPQAGLRDALIPAELEALAPGRIHYAGELAFPVLRAVVRQADWLVFPSLYEGFGFPPLEALACGTRVLTADLPPVRETCGELPVYFEDTTEQGLRRGLEQALSVPDLNNQERGRQCAGLYTWEKTADATVRALTRTFAL